MSLSRDNTIEACAGSPGSIHALQKMCLRRGVRIDAGCRLVGVRSRTGRTMWPSSGLPYIKYPYIEDEFTRSRPKRFATQRRQSRRFHRPPRSPTGREWTTAIRSKRITIKTIDSAAWNWLSDTPTADSSRVDAANDPKGNKTHGNGMWAPLRIAPNGSSGRMVGANGGGGRGEGCRSRSTVMDRFDLDRNGTLRCPANPFGIAALRSHHVNRDGRLEAETNWEKHI